MDPITEFAFNLNNGLLTYASLIINNDLIFLLIITALVLLIEKRDGKRAKIFSAIILSAVFVVLIKSFMMAERPCVSLGLEYCPESYSFPSMHATIAFTMMISFINKKSYWIFMIFALFVAFTRMVLAVHSFIDIAGALPVALITYYIIDVVGRSLYGKNRA